MNRKTFCISATLGSLVGATLFALLITPQNFDALSTAGERIFWVGGFFLAVFAGGFAGLHLTLHFSRKYKIQRSRFWIPAFLLACVLLFGIGAGGQALFMYSKEEVIVPASADMVLLLDASGSMDSSGYTQPRTDAGCQFVSSLSDDNRLQAVSFAGTVLDSTSLVNMDAQGKNTLTQFIQGIDSVGATDFNAPLRQAMQTLNQYGRTDCGKAVILLTDGDGDLNSDVIQTYLGSDVKVFTVRISSDSYLSYDAQALADFAVDTGGFDVQLTPAADGTVNAADMLKAFQDAFQATSETRVNMSKDLLVYAEQTSFWQFLLRVIVFILCAVLIGIGYFGQFSLKLSIANGVCGLISAVLVTLLNGSSYGLCVAVICLLMTTALVSLDMKGEDVYDV